MSAAAAMLARMSAAATSIITVPVLLGYLGLERYGLWLTLAAATAWLGLGHLGTGPSLLNRLASVGRTDRPERERLVATAWWMSVGLGAAAVAVVVTLHVLGIWASAANVSAGVLSEEAGAVAIALGLGAAASMPLSVPLTVLRADQAGYFASAVEVAASLGRLGAIVLAVRLDAGIGAVAAVAVMAPGLVLLLAGFAVFGRRVAWPSPRLASRGTSRTLLTTGVGFTGMAVAGLLISSTDVIVIAQVLGPASVPPYSIAFALLILFVGLEMAVLDAIWPAYAEAAAAGERNWIRVTNRKITIGLVLAAGAFSLGLLLVGTRFIEWWAGPDAVPPQSLLFALAAIAMVQAVLLPHGRALTALGNVRRNTVLSLAGAAINLPTSIVLAGILGITGVALGTLAAYVVTGAFLVRSARRAIAHVGLPALETSPR